MAAVPTNTTKESYLYQWQLHKFSPLTLVQMLTIDKYELIFGKFKFESIRFNYTFRFMKTSFLVKGLSNVARELGMTLHSITKGSPCLLIC